MPTHAEVSRSIGNLRNTIEQALRRCTTAPYPSSDRQNRAEELANRLNAETVELAKAVASVEAPHRREHQDAEAALQTNQKQLQDAQHQRQRLRPTGRDAPERTRVQEEIGQADAKIQTLQDEVHHLTRTRDEAQRATNTAIQAMQGEPASQGLLDVEERLRVLVDDVGAFERRVISDANESLVQDVGAVFKADTKVFFDAEKHHLDSAKLTFYALAGLLAVAAVAIYFLFVHPDFIAPSDAVGAGGNSGNAVAAGGHATTQGPASVTHPSTLTLERVLLLVTGRFAIIFFLGWALHYVAALHRAHSEQAVIYRDRMAGLGVAEVVVSATPRLEQKLDTLKVVVRAYLRIGRSAFSTKPARKRTKPRSFDTDVKRLKTTVEAVKPVLDAVGGAIERGK